MAISTNYVTLQRQIADELGDRQDLLSVLSGSSLTLSPIKNAIQSAIAKWEREPFYFNELSSLDLFDTVANQELYTTSDSALIATMSDLADIHIVVNGDRYVPTRRNWQYIEEISVSPTLIGRPTDWAYYAESVRLYPIPDAAYHVTLNGTQRVTALSEDSDSNVWTQDGFDLIRCEAKLILARDTLHDPQIVSECMVAIYGNPAEPRDKGFLGALRTESTRRARGRMRPTQF